MIESYELIVFCEMDLKIRVFLFEYYERDVIDIIVEIPSELRRKFG